MITDITPTAYKINGVLIDLVYLNTYFQLYTDSRVVHDGYMMLSVIKNLHERAIRHKMVYKTDYKDAELEERAIRSSGWLGSRIIQAQTERAKKLGTLYVDY